MNAPEATRFAGFSAEEILELWEALTFDDGIRYYPEAGSIEARLIAELELEWQRRLPSSWGVTLEEARRRSQ